MKASWTKVSQRVIKRPTIMKFSFFLSLWHNITVIYKRFNLSVSHLVWKLILLPCRITDGFGDGVLPMSFLGYRTMWKICALNFFQKRFWIRDYEFWSGKKEWRKESLTEKSQEQGTNTWRQERAETKPKRSPCLPVGGGIKVQGQRKSRLMTLTGQFREVKC